MSTLNLDLAQLFNFYGSDKDRNGYSPLYHTLFDHMKEKPINMLEIGIGTMIPGAHSSMVGYALEGYKPGGSLRAWRDYFINGNIIGMDVQSDTQFNDERINTYLCNSTDNNVVQQTMSRLNTKQFDIILDDGDHYHESQLKTLRNFYPYVKQGGIYIIEDIYPGSLVTTNHNLVKEIVGGDPFFFVGINNNQCVIFKNHIDMHPA